MSTPLDLYFEQDASRLVGDVNRVMRNRGKMSMLMERGELPEGIGFNYQTAISERSAIVNGVTWSAVSTPNGSTNNCTPTITDMGWASSLKSYSAEQALLRSDRICFTDAARGYLFDQQVGNIQKNFVDNVFEAWDDRDKLAYFTNAGHKIVADSALTDYENATDFGPTQATYKITQSILDQIYVDLVQDGAGEDAYAYSNGAPLFTVLMSMERQTDIFNEDTTVRQVLEYAEMGKGYEGTLLQAWGIKRNFRGFMHLIDNRMPRFNWADGDYVPVPYWQNTAGHIGDISNVNPAYKSAQYEDMYIWSPKVVKRLMPKAPHSVGGDTSFDAVPFSGELTWRNIAEADPESPEFNPLSNMGRFWSALMVAYAPNVVRYGYILRVRRCPTVTASTCY
jgi:hypothetical protein